MTISDKQRRAVAQELRKLTSPGRIRYAEEFYEELREIVACDLDGSFEGVMNSLADLIDRPTCSMSDIGDDTEQIYRCSDCGDEYFMSEFTEFPWRFCPNCGAEVIND